MQRDREYRRPLPPPVLLLTALALWFAGTRFDARHSAAPVLDYPSWVRVATTQDEHPSDQQPSDQQPSDEQPSDEHRDGPSDAMQALQYWSAQRAYPGRAIPDAAFGVAVAQLRALTARERRIESVVPPWQPLGPTNIGGRTLCLAQHPTDLNVLFAGSASGGLWKSTTGGVGADAWDYVDTGFPVLGVSTIAIDPNDGNTMYIGTGEAYSYSDSIGGDAVRLTRGSYGIGIVKSTDGGVTWTSSLDWAYQQSRGVWMIQIHPTNSAILYAATTEGVYKSVDAGASWVLVHGVIMAMDVRIHPTNPDTVFASHGNFDSVGRGIYRSTDGGQNWTLLGGGLPATWSGKSQLAIAKTAPNTVFASIADSGGGLGLYKSTNAGNSWNRVNNTDYPQYQGWFAHYVVVSPFDAQTLFTSGVEIWRSTNGGAALSERSNWQSVFMGTSPPQGPIGGLDYAHADHHFALWHHTDPNTVFFASDGGVFRTTNLGNSFESLIGGYQTTQFYNGFSQSATRMSFAIGGLQDNFSAIYDGAAPWRRVIGGDGAWTAVNPANDATIYGSSQYLNMSRSRDSGNNWVNISPPNPAGSLTSFVAPFVLCPAQPTVLYAGRSRVYRSDNEGSIWATTNGGAELDPGNPVISLAVADTTAETAYAGTAPVAGRARVFTTRNGGTTWLDVTGSLPDRYPSDITVDPSDPMKVYVTFLGFGTSHLFGSTNGGNSWMDLDGGRLPDIPASAVVVDSDHTAVLYVGTDLGVFISIDAGGSWRSFSDGMPLAMVNDLKVYRAGRKLRAATHGNGVYERDLLGIPAVHVTSCRLDAAVCPGSAPHSSPPRPGETMQVTLRFDNAGGDAVAADLVGTIVASNAVVTVPAGGDLALLPPISVAAGGFVDVAIELLVDAAVTCPATVEISVTRLTSDAGQFTFPDESCATPFADINCTTVCILCGNGLLDQGEGCDDGNRLDCDGCSASCQLDCGNGVVECAETCDDGNTAACDGCSQSCQLECGNGALECNENCDDGNVVSCDGCSTSCQLECGNGVVECAETCDDGSVVACDGCSASCSLECGNGVVECNESCDDGDVLGCDNCSTRCEVECGDGVVECAETCDDGGVDTTSCDADCSAAVCGDGHLNPAAGEECDDGNTQEGDGCTAACLDDCASLLPRVELLQGVRFPTDRVDFTWAPLTAPQLHLNFVDTKPQLVDPTVLGNGSTDCSTTGGSCTTSGFITLGVRFYQVVAACGITDEGPF